MSTVKRKNESPDQYQRRASGSGTDNFEKIFNYLQVARDMYNTQLDAKETAMYDLWRHNVQRDDDERYDLAGHFRKHVMPGIERGIYGDAETRLQYINAARNAAQGLQNQQRQSEIQLQQENLAKERENAYKTAYDKAYADAFTGATEVPADDLGGTFLVPNSKYPAPGTRDPVTGQLLSPIDPATGQLYPMARSPISGRPMLTGPVGEPGVDNQNIDPATGKLYPVAHSPISGRAMPLTPTPSPAGPGIPSPAGGNEAPIPPGGPEPGDPNYGVDPTLVKPGADIFGPDSIYYNPEYETDLNKYYGGAG